MGEFFASIKAFLEKVNLITFLLALAVAIAVYQLLVRDWLWALFGFCECKSNLFAFAEPPPLLAPAIS